MFGEPSAVPGLPLSQVLEGPRWVGGEPLHQVGWDAPRHQQKLVEVALEDVCDPPEELVARVLATGFNLRDVRNSDANRLSEDTLCHRPAQPFAFDSLPNQLDVTHERTIAIFADLRN